jgi:hypothetical protein
MATPPLGVNAEYRPYRLLPASDDRFLELNLPEYQPRLSNLYSLANGLRKSTKLSGLAIVTAVPAAIPLE